MPPVRVIRISFRATVPNPSLGQLSKLPLELRNQIYEYLNENYCFHVIEPVSLFQSNRHDPCIPVGVSRVSKTIWHEVSQLLRNHRPRILKIRFCVNGWRSNYHPSAFRDDWEAPDLSLFTRLDIRVAPPPLNDPAQALLTRRNVISFVNVLYNCPALPPVQILFGKRATSWENIYFHPSNPLKLCLPSYYRRLSSHVPLLALFVYSFMRLNRHKISFLIPSVPPDFVHDFLKFRDFDLCFVVRSDATILAMGRMLDLILDRLLNEMPGRTAWRLRIERRRARVTYREWFYATRRALVSRSREQERAKNQMFRYFLY